MCKLILEELWTSVRSASGQRWVSVESASSQRQVKGEG